MNSKIRNIIEYLQNDKCVDCRFNAFMCINLNNLNGIYIIINE